MRRQHSAYSAKILVIRAKIWIDTQQHLGCLFLVCLPFLLHRILPSILRLDGRNMQQVD